ncbi:MAG: VirB3 family type IV secretion system protein [Succinivibrionaceae bacterium]|nr:VirB3 family type IV secretion system protein [Succinivibrionaceae bacterium]
MRTVPIHRSLHRVNTFMGGDREVVMCSALIAFISVFFGQSFSSFVLGIAFWLVVLTFARIINKSDPLMRKVFMSNLRFRQGYFPAHSHIMHKESLMTYRQNFKTGFKSSGFGYK